MTKTVLLKENEFIIEVHPDGIRARNPHKPDNKHFVHLVNSLKVVDDVMYEVRKNAERMMKNSTPQTGSPDIPQTGSPDIPQTGSPDIPQTGSIPTPPPDDSPLLPSTSSDLNLSSKQQESSLPLSGLS